MSNRNFVAKHMNTFNRSSVVEDKRDKHLDDLYDQEIEDALSENENDTDE